MAQTIKKFKIMKHIPNKIFLNIGYEPEKGDDFNDLEEVTWCVDKVNDSDIEYQRKPIWHDLRKNPKDLPDTMRSVLIEIKDYDRYISDVGKYITDDNIDNNGKTLLNTPIRWCRNHVYGKIIAWADIPKFKD